MATRYKHLNIDKKKYGNMTTWTCSCYVPDSPDGPYFVMCSTEVIFVYPQSCKISFIQVSDVVYDIEYITSSECKFITKNTALFQYGGLFINDCDGVRCWLYTIDMRYRELIYADITKNSLSVSLSNETVYVLEEKIFEDQVVRTYLCNHNTHHGEDNMIELNADFMKICSNSIIIERDDDVLCLDPDTLNSRWIFKSGQFIAQQGDYVIVKQNFMNTYFIIHTKIDFLNFVNYHNTLYFDTTIVVGGKWIIESPNDNPNEIVITKSPFTWQ
jgi:hypothetical protein